jgi:hypothetical protein
MARTLALLEGKQIGNSCLSADSSHAMSKAVLGAGGKLREEQMMNAFQEECLRVPGLWRVVSKFQASS